MVFKEVISEILKQKMCIHVKIIFKFMTSYFLSYLFLNDKTYCIYCFWSMSIKD